jgi:hypothetical protein
MKARIPLLVAASLFCTAAYSSDDGDPKAKVADLCGEPTQTERRTVLRSGAPRQYYGNDSSRVGTRTVSDAELLIHNRSVVEVEVEIWLYNRGSRNLMRELVFHDNRLVAVNVLGRGY